VGAPRMRPAVLLLLALAPLAVPAGLGQDASLPVQPGPGLAVLVHHPYPDEADPLGFPWPEGSPVGAFVTRHAWLDAAGDGFDFPSFVADGRILVEGVPEGPDPVAATRAAYEGTIAGRAREEAPVALRVYAPAADGVRRVMVQAEPVAPLPGEDLRLWMALVEEPVHFEPPPALSNGVSDHPFTVRAVAEPRRMDLSSGEPAGASHAFTLAPGWNATRLHVAVWLEQEAGPGLRFAPHEVVQATMHPLAWDGVSLQQEKGVLVEAYSATWCDPCLYGDRAIEELAAAYGLGAPREPASAPTRYFQAPGSPLLVAAAAAAAGLAGALVGGRRGGAERGDRGADDRGHGGAGAAATDARPEGEP